MRYTCGKQTNRGKFLGLGELQFKVINNDYATDSIQELARLYKEDLSDGL